MAITSSTDICNLALDLLNAGVVIDVENPSNPTEELLNRWYDQARRKALREHPWNFAIKRAILSSSATAPPFGYSKKFPLPADFIRIADVFNDEGYSVSKSLYAVEDGGVSINSDGTALRIRYVYDFTEVTAMEPLFIDFLSLEIALCIAYKVTDNNTNIQRIGELHKMRGALSRAIDGQESPPMRREESRAIRARKLGTTEQPHRIIF